MKEGGGQVGMKGMQRVVDMKTQCDKHQRQQYTLPSYSRSVLLT